jgi:hypothetical protein
MRVRGRSLEFAGLKIEGLRKRAWNAADGAGGAPAASSGVRGLATGPLANFALDCPTPASPARTALARGCPPRPGSLSGDRLCGEAQCGRPAHA